MNKSFLLLATFLSFFLLSQNIIAQDITPNKKMYGKSFYHQKAPEFVVEKWLSDVPDMKGKFIMIDFWATWCGPCKRSIPQINEWYNKYKDRMVVIGVSDEPEAKVLALKEPKKEYYSAIDTKKRMSKTYEVSGIPHIVIIDPQGIVRWQGFPFLAGYELTDEVIDEILEKYSK
ncbi:MAG: redoxin domain-containing protein [Bacteroidales bacterium]|jgi:cytochrome c biogenesis protein CcmG/thiol:disulfide interchange protein DsbE|nr:redoxin domain-containing protein [Bacteroidales bacterium]MDI9592558.1 redoxin domain-containing protein [Bacteroidota bacterium]NLH33121.1 redoxin domain-containing protein [Lentimicrobium sp.]OQC37497.1 MAG: Thiol-disulfide oxidoreductase ResA [Bacteroidetes bacterium ADurb.Bin041]MCZ2282459.1 redoxin domain-containing protein [Bacteroidales bacterium]